MFKTKTKTRVLDYRAVMREAARRKLSLRPEERVEWRCAFSDGPTVVYESVNAYGKHVIRGTAGVILAEIHAERDASVLLRGAPTISAAETAVSVALRLGLA